MIDISIIIPTFNRLWSLPKAIESCRLSLKEIEIIVIDDGSTDGTWSWLQKQDHIIKIRQDNWGKCWAVNHAMEIASGKYIRFLDSDDMISAEANDLQVSIAEDTNADIVVAGHQLIDVADNLLNKIHWTNCNDFIAQQLGECDSSHYSAYLFKKEFISSIPHRPDFAFRDDRLLVIEAAIKSPKVVVYEGYPLLHRIHSTDRLQLRSGIQQSVQNFQHYTIYRKAMALLENTGQLNQRRKNAATNSLWPLAHWIAKTHLQDAIGVVNWIYKLNPDFQIPEKGSLGWMYRKMGFANTEKILRLRRILKYDFRND
jgi:glycosyltransferase involved in cell wall biosynthesis